MVACDSLAVWRKIGAVPATPRSVLLVTRTYPPDSAAVGQLVADLAAELAARGCRVGIATTTPDPGGANAIAGCAARVAGAHAMKDDAASLVFE